MGSERDVYKRLDVRLYAVGSERDVYNRLNARL